MKLLLIALLLITSNALAFTGTLTGTFFSGITDDFNRSSIGENWTVIPTFSNIVITSNQLTGDATQRTAAWTADTLKNNQWVQATAVALTTSRDWTIGVRASTSEFTGYFLNVASTGWDIYKVVNEAGSELANETVAIANGSIIKLAITDNVLTVYVNGVARGVTATDSGTTIASGRAAVSVATSGVSLDNFAAGSL